MTDVVVMLERLAAEPKPFAVIGLWRHADGTLERKQYRAALPRRTMAENAANGLRRFIGRADTTAAGTAVVLEAVAIEERHDA